MKKEIITITTSATTPTTIPPMAPPDMVLDEGAEVGAYILSQRQRFELEA